MLKPTTFKIGGRKYYLTDVLNIVSKESEVKFFEFVVKCSDDYTPNRILVFAGPGGNGGPRTWEWFIFLKSEVSGPRFSYHYKDIINPEKDFFLFAEYVKRVTPEALPYILFNYIA